jgi:large subunit ribosomal protein L23
MHFYEVLRRPLITEKSALLQESNQYTFEVNKCATKSQIREAVERAFHVEVADVNVMIVHGKTRRMGLRQVVRPSWKKAVVTLKEGHKVAFFEGV